jgi:co-chaperonin GroES (HSP10)
MYELNEKTKAVGRRVLLQIIPERQYQELGGIILPESMNNSENQKLIKGKVVSIGQEAEKMLLNIGDIVYFDKWSQFAPNGDGRATEEPNAFVLVNFDASIVAIQKEGK